MEIVELPPIPEKILAEPENHKKENRKTIVPDIQESVIGVDLIEENVHEPGDGYPLIFQKKKKI